GDLFNFNVKHLLTNKFPVLIRILLHSQACWLHLSAIAFLSLLSLPLTLLYPLPIKIAIDTVLAQQPLPPFVAVILPTAHGGAVALSFAIGLMLAIALIVNLQGLASGWLQTYLGEKLVWAFLARLLSHVERLPLAFH